jgi:tellurite methyltransferase
MNQALTDAFGNIDIYLFDQLLKGKFDDCKNVLDVGCGTGRNLIYFLREGLEVFGIDQNEGNIEEVKKLSRRLSPANPIENFVAAQAEEIPFRDEVFELVICNAVLHFAKSHDHFDAMLRSCWRVLKPKGFLFVRLASSIGIEDKIKPAENGRYLLPDGSARFLVNEKMLLDYTKELNGELFEPLKTTNVQGLRCMTTWCLQKKII